jgi:holin-like protein
MTPHKLIIHSRRLVHRSGPLQIGLVCAFWAVGEAVVRFAGLPIPGSIVGMLIALALLSSRRISLSSMRRGAQWFLAEMLLFFVPAVLAVLDHHEFFGLLGLKILIVILVGTFTVMGVTAFTVDLCYRLRSGHGSAHPVLE